jgi:O-antigen ligase
MVQPCRVFSNLDVAFYTIKQSLLTGSGLGGHEEMYYRRFEYDSFRYNYYYGLNAKSAHSLSIRILSEFGILGFGLYLFTLIKNVMFFKSKVPKAIALACLSHFLCKTLKLGGYIDYGTPFFLCMLILNARYFQSKIK